MLSDSNEKPAEKEKAKHTQTRYCVYVCFLEISPLDFLHFQGKLVEDYCHVLKQIASLRSSQLQETEISYSLIFSRETISQKSDKVTVIV